MTSSRDQFPDAGPVPGSAAAVPGPAAGVPPAASPATGTARLDTAECWRLLESARLGRLAVSDAHGAPDIFPVNFIAFEGCMYLRTSAGTKLSRIATNPAVALEIDGEDGEARWSVVVHGDAQQVRDDAELEASGAARMVPWSPGHKPFIVKITPHSVTGRRFGKKRPARTRAIRPDASDSPASPAPRPEAAEPEGGRGAERARRPDPIPHRRPVQNGHQ